MIGTQRGILMDKPTRPEKEELKEKLSPMAYAVTQENATERPFTGKYDDFTKRDLRRYRQRRTVI